jgi:hypothetical protein
VVPRVFTKMRGGARATGSLWVCLYSALALLLIIIALFVFFSINCRWLNNSQSHPPVGLFNCPTDTAAASALLSTVLPLSIEKHAARIIAALSAHRGLETLT